MATFGFAGLTIEYQLSSEAKYPAAVQDCREAVLWVQTNSKKYNLDPKRIGVAGQSAGGHLAAMLGITSNKVIPVVTLNPILDFVAIAGTNYDEANSAITKFLVPTYTENPTLWKEASPFTYISKNSPPMLFLHGKEDKTVPYSQSVTMYNKLRMVGVPAELYSVEGAAHLWFFNSNEYFLSSLNQMREFFQKYL